MYGLVAGILTVILAMVMHFAKLEEKPLVGWLTYIPFLAAMVMNAMNFSKTNDGYVTFKQLFGSCFKASMIVALFMVVWTVVSLYAFPEIKEKALETARIEMLKKPGMTDDTADAALNIVKKGYGTILVSSAVFGSLFIGAIFSLIGATVAQKKGERPVTDNF